MKEYQYQYWAKMPNRDSLLKGTHLGTMYVVNLILNKYLNGMAENRTKKSLEYVTGADVPKQTNNTLIWMRYLMRAPI